MQRCSLGKCRSKPRDIISHLLEWLLSKPNKQTKITSIGKDAEKRESLCTPGRNVNRYSHYGNCMEVPQKIKNRTTIRSSNSTCGYFSRENKDPSLKSYVYAMFILVLFTITKIWKQPKGQLIDEWIMKMWCIYTMGYYSATKNKILSFATTWMDLEGIMLSQINQT